MSASLSSPLVGVDAPGRFGPVGLGVAAAHGLLIAWFVSADAVAPLVELARPIAVRMVEEVVPRAAPPAPPPVQARPRPQAARAVAPSTPVAAPVAAPMAAEAAPPVAPVAVAVAVAPVPAPAVAPPAEPPVTTARFDADYLHNPKPAYPSASRRLGEEGRVLLRVLVSADGRAEQVELKTTSGYARLDAAAQEAVARWRFAPARRGEQAISAWVAVPIVFSLES